MHIAYRRSTFRVAKVIPDQADLSYELDINPEKEKMQTGFGEKCADGEASRGCLGRANRARASSAFRIAAVETGHAAIHAHDRFG